MLNDTLISNIKDLVKSVGSFQLKHFRHMPKGSDIEKAARDLVSFVDVESEKKLIEGLSEILPEAGFFGEESGRSGNQDLVWIIDPLDGTTNFLNGLDQFSISVGLVEEGKTLFGIVYRPFSDETYWASKGQGFFYNDEKQLLVTSRPLAKALVGTGFPYRSADMQKSFFSCAEKVLTSSRGLRRFASAALDLTYLACGRFQGFWESDLQPYDVAAALLFLEETGCIVSNENGEVYDLFTDRIIIVGVPEAHGQLKGIIGKYYNLKTQD